MTFTFTDYTYSGLLSILASLYGVGYPLIIQSISNIYSLYDSSRLAQRFTSEPLYRTFQCVLIVNLAIAVIMPFLLLKGDNIRLLLTFQTISVIVLLTISFMLFRLIVKYSNADQLITHLTKGAISKDNVEAIFDLAIHADRKRNPQLYNNAMSSVFAYFIEQQRQQEAEDADVTDISKVQTVRYDYITHSILENIRNYIREAGQNYYLHKHNDVISILYNQVSSTRIDLSTHHVVWRMIVDAVVSDNRTWFAQYWQYADSYDHLTYHYPKHNDARQLDCDTFRLRHIMIGAMLVHHDRNNYLNDILFYTHSQPEYFGLIPSTFGEIIESVEKLDKLFAIPYFHTQAFHFADEMGGIKDESFLFHEAIRYYALLMIRLWSLHDHIYIGHDVFAIPDAPLLLREDERDISVMKMVLSEVSEWYRKDVFKLIPRIQPVPEVQVTSVINQYVDVCTQSIEQKNKNPEVSTKKLVQLLDRNTKISKTFTLQPPTANSHIDALESKCEYYRYVSNSESVTTLHHTDYMIIDAEGTIDMLWTNFSYAINRYYVSFIDRQFKIERFCVHHTLVEELLTKLDLSDDYVVIALGEVGVIKEKYGTIKTYNLSGFVPNRVFYILRKEQLPYVSLEPIEKDLPSDMVELQSLPNVYTNLEQFKDCHEPTYNLNIAACVSVHSSSKSIGVIEIEIDNSYKADPGVLPEVTKLKELYESIEKEK